jgi:TolB protein
MLSRNKLAIWLIIPLIISIIVGCTTDKKPTLTTSLVSDTASPTITNLPTLELTQTPYVVTATPVTVAGPQNVFIFSMMDNGYAHLFAYSPQGFPLTRLTTDPWDDITPALSPDGTQVAFSSRRNGYWDLY